MIRRPPRSTLDRSSAASDVYKRQRPYHIEIPLNHARILEAIRNENMEERIKTKKIPQISSQRPYHVENTASRPISEVKQGCVWLVLGWETAWEHQILLAFAFLFCF